MPAKFATYQAAVQNLKANPSSAVDKTIVDLWDASKTLVKDNQRLTAELADANARCRHMAGTIEMLNTKAAQQRAPKASEGDKYLAKLHQTAPILAEDEAEKQ